jgi:hypothetical protein
MAGCCGYTAGIVDWLVMLGTTSSWIQLSQMLAVVKLKRSTYQGYVSGGLLARIDERGCSEADLLELTMVLPLRDYLGIDELTRRWRTLRAKGEVARFVAYAQALEPDEHNAQDAPPPAGQTFDLVCELDHGRIRVAASDHELARAVRGRGLGRPLVVIDLVPQILEARDAYGELAMPGEAPARRPGRPARKSATVTQLRSA